MNERTDKVRLTLMCCALLAGATLAVYWPVLHYPFINLDDPEYVTQNPYLQGGLSWANITWAFTSGYAANWHPLTWLSHMLDVQWFGANAGLHHLTSLLFHIANAVLLFLVLNRMTGALWRSACVAGIFTLHPLHVESVAWVAERKDVLSAFFFMLTLGAYGRYAELRKTGLGSEREDRGQTTEDRRQKTEDRRLTAGHRSETTALQAEDSPERIRRAGQRSGVRGRTSARSNVLTLQRFNVLTLLNPSTLQPFNPSTAWYALSLVAFALGLMSKPMLVTVPFLLLLLDYWPLRRFDFENHRSKLKSLGMEKLPFLALAIGSSVVTFLVQDASKAVGAVFLLPVEARIANAVLSYFKYLVKTFWPADLGVFYPHRYLHYPMLEPIVTVPIVAGAAVLVAVTMAVLLRMRIQPYLATGWFWFLGMLVPVIGLVQVGSQAMADRYMYLPLIGLSICVVWGAADFLRERRFAAPLSAATAGLVLAACAGLTWKQVGYWRDDVALFTHTLAVTTNNAQAHSNLASALGRQGKYDEAIEHLRAALAINPTYGDAHYNLGYAYMSQGKLEDAATEYETTLRLRPEYLAARNNLGAVLLAMGKPAAAAEQYTELVRVQPDSALYQFNLGRTLFAAGDFAGATAHFSEAVRLNPNDVDPLLGLGNALFASGQTNEALASFDKALQIDPALPGKLLQAGKTLLAQGQFELALGQLLTLLRFQPENAEAHENVALIYAQQNKLEQALPHFERCLDLRPNAQSYYNLGLARVMQGHIPEALTNYEQAVKLNPDWPTALNDLAWLLATAPQADARNGAEAVRLAERACQLDGGKEARFWGTLDAAYAEAGRFDDAVTAAEKARQLAVAANQTDLVKAAETRLALYRNHHAFHQGP